MTNKPAIPRWGDGIDPLGDPEPGDRLGRRVWRARKAWIMTMRELSDAQDRVKDLRQKERRTREAVALAEGQAFSPPATATKAGEAQVKRLLNVLIALGVRNRDELARVLDPASPGADAPAVERLEALLITAGFRDAEISHMALGIRCARGRLEALLEGFQEQKVMLIGETV